MSRRCVGCQEPILECMGFVKAGDIIELLDGKRTTVRELCGLCSELYSWTPDCRLEKTPIEGILAFEVPRNDNPSPYPGDHSPLP